MEVANLKFCVCVCVVKKSTTNEVFIDLHSELCLKKLIIMIHHMPSFSLLPKAGVCNIDHVEEIF